MDPLDLRPEPVAEAARIMKAGGVVVFPTHALYGLGADAFHSAAVQRVFAIKRRPPAKPLPVLIPERRWLSRLTDEIPPAAEKLMAAFWPGPVTLVFRARPDVPSLLTGGSGKIGLRMPGSRIAGLLVGLTAGPITATSANLAGRLGVSRIADLDPAILKAVDLVLDGGTLPGRAASTVIDVTVFPPRVLREGEIPAARVASVLGA